MIDVHGSDLPVGPAEDSLFGDVTSLIERARGRVAVTVNAELTMLYWGIGTRIREDVLGLEKPEYGKAVVERLAERLVARYGRGYSTSSLFRMMRLAAIYESREILAPLVPKLTWSHFLQLIVLEDSDMRRFYETLAAREHWSRRALSQQIQRRLYQRALDGRDPAALAADLADAASGEAPPGLLLRDSYVLDRCRVKRNNVTYDAAGTVSDAEMAELLREATSFTVDVLTWVRANHPELLHG